MDNSRLEIIASTIYKLQDAMSQSHTPILKTQTNKQYDKQNLWCNYEVLTAQFWKTCFLTEQ